MPGRSARWGVAAATGLAAFYVAVLVAAAGWQHLGSQARQDWWLLAPIVIGFGTQVALTAGEVTVKITPVRIAADAAVFEVVFDTHSVELDLDVTSNARLTVAGTNWPEATWQGSGPGATTVKARCSSTPPSTRPEHLSSPSTGSPNQSGRPGPWRGE